MLQENRPGFTLSLLQALKYYENGIVVLSNISLYIILGDLCKTVRPRLRDRCLCPVCLSVTLVYRGETVGWIKLPLSTEVGLGPGDIVLDDGRPSHQVLSSCFNVE